MRGVALTEDALLWENIELAKEGAKTRIDTFQETMAYVFTSALAQSDIKALKDAQSVVYDTPVIAPFVRRQIETVTDGIPSFQAKTNDESALSEDGVKIINDKLNNIFDKSSLKRQNYKAIRNAIAGGFGTYEVSIDYANNKDFTQTVSIKAVDDIIYFDPRSEDDDEADATYCFKLFFQSEDALKSKYPDVDFKSMIFGKDCALEERKIGSKSDKRELQVCDYYYLSAEVATIYMLKDGHIAYDKPAEKADIATVRNAIKNVCKFQRIVGNQIIDTAELPFSSLPFVQVCSEVIRNSKGEKVIVPYAAPATAAQRLKSIAASLYAGAAYACPPARTRVPKESLADKSVKSSAKETSTRDLFVYRQYINNGTERIPLNPPDYMPPPPISPAYGMLSEMADGMIKQALGVEFDVNQMGNLSGKALYNMADFMNSNIKGFVENLLNSLKRCAHLTLEALKAVDKDIKPLDIDNAHIILESGINYKLQQQATLEMLLELANVSPTLAKFLDEQGIELLLENMDLNEKSKIIGAYKKFSDPKNPNSPKNPKNQPPIPPQIQLEQAKLQLQGQKQQMDFEMKQMEMAAKQKQMQLDELKLQLDSQKNSNDAVSEHIKAMMDKYKAELEAIVSQMQHQYDLTQTLIAHSGKQDN
jgi:hypothetical protein